MESGSNNNQFDSQLYLSPNQQDLLLAALNSNSGVNQDMYKASENLRGRAGNFGTTQTQQFSMDAIDPSFFSSVQDAPAAGFGNFNVEESPYVDFLDGDVSFDFDTSGHGEMMIGSLPGESPEDYGDEDSPESHDKRKSPDDEEDEEEVLGTGKRREGSDKTAKKPGRKPLTSEPTTKRKAQNRAAQRAFRERKEKHLKDLETKVEELSKASDAKDQENGLLRAQLQRLQTELREYRKRLSLTTAGATNKSSLPANGFSYLSGLNGANSTFQFEFPRFGGLPGTHMLNTNTAIKNSTTNKLATKPGINAVPGILARQGSAGNSPGSQDGFSPLKSGTFQKGNHRNGMANAMTQQKRSSTDSTYGSNNNNFQTKAASTSSTTDSPSASSVSQYGGPSSSCDTSPEPSHNSPPTTTESKKYTIENGYKCHGNSEGEVTFCEKLNMACGTPQNPIPRAMSMSNGLPATPGITTTAAAAVLSTVKSPSGENTGIDFFANQNGGQFDPVLFGDYRESQNAVMGDGDFTGGFFDDAFGMPSYSSPASFHFGDTPAITTANKPNPLEEIERIQDGDDEEVVPGEDTTQMLNCHRIWDKLANRPDFKDGTIDIDSLCTELRAKARCSESGVVVDNKDVEAALGRLPDQPNAS